MTTIPGTVAGLQRTLAIGRAVWRDLKAHHLAHQTFTDVADLDQAIHNAIRKSVTPGYLLCLEDGKQRAGFRREEPAFFSWLGVTQYLSKKAVMATFAEIRSLCPESAVVFDYALPRDALPEAEKLTFDTLSAGVEWEGEPFRSFFRPGSLTKDLRAIGYRRVERPMADDLNARYFRDRLDGLKVTGHLGGLMCAS